MVETVALRVRLRGYTAPLRMTQRKIAPAVIRREEVAILPRVILSGGAYAAEVEPRRGARKGRILDLVIAPSLAIAQTFPFRAYARKSTKQGFCA